MSNRKSLHRPKDIFISAIIAILIFLLFTLGGCTSKHVQKSVDMYEVQHDRILTIAKSMKDMCVAKIIPVDTCETIKQHYNYYVEMHNNTGEIMKSIVDGSKEYSQDDYDASFIQMSETALELLIIYQDYKELKE